MRLKTVIFALLLLPFFLLINSGDASIEEVQNITIETFNREPLENLTYTPLTETLTFNQTVHNVLITGVNAYWDIMGSLLTYVFSTPESSKTTYKELYSIFKFCLGLWIGYYVIRILTYLIGTTYVIYQDNKRRKALNENKKS